MKNTIIGSVIGAGVGFAVDRLFKKAPPTQTEQSTTETDTIKEFDFDFPQELEEHLQLFSVYFGTDKGSELRNHVKSLLSKPKTCMTLTQKSSRIIETVREKYQIKAILSDVDMTKLNEYDKVKASELLENLNDCFDDALNNYVSDIQLELQ